jgi:hypothetical protein
MGVPPALLTNKLLELYRACSENGGVVQYCTSAAFGFALWGQLCTRAGKVKNEPCRALLSPPELLGKQRQSVRHLTSHRSHRSLGYNWLDPFFGWPAVMGEVCIVFLDNLWG